MMSLLNNLLLVLSGGKKEVLLSICTVILVLYIPTMKQEVAAGNPIWNPLVDTIPNELPVSANLLGLVEQMPLYGDCDHAKNLREQRQCSYQKLQNFVGKHAQYPSLAAESGITGLAVVRFVVEQDGTINSPEIVRDPGGALGQEALRLVQLMMEKGESWTPSKQRGRAVRKTCFLPIQCLGPGQITVAKELVGRGELASELDTKMAISHSNTPEIPPTSSAPSPRIAEIIDFREIQPYYGHCEGAENYPAKKACSLQKVRQFVEDHRQYPKQALAAQVEGTAVVKFNIGKDGVMRDWQIIRDPGAGLGAEALRIVELMATQGETWTPAEQGGKPVAVQFNLPVKFKLDKVKATASPASSAPSLPPVTTEYLWDFREATPIYGHCADTLKRWECKKSANQKLLQFIYQNLQYPSQASAAKVEGIAVVAFEVGKDGIMRDWQIVRDPGAGLGQEALRLVELLATEGEPWTPGEQRGRPVDIRYNLPVKFTLEEVKATTPPTRSAPSPPPPPAPPPPPVTTDCFGMIQEVMPYYGRYADTVSRAECETASGKKLLQFIYQNIQYPSEAIEAQVEGRVGVTFEISKEGTMRNWRIMRDPGAGLGEEALRVVELLATKGELWTPGEQRGRPVAVQYNLPIKFKLDEEKTVPPYVCVMRDHEDAPVDPPAQATPPPPPPLPPPPEQPIDQEIFRVVEEMPQYGDCSAAETHRARSQCSSSNVLRFIYQRIQYPPIGLDCEPPGTAVVQFVVEKDGRMSDIRLIRDPGGHFGEEALRVTQLLATEGERWRPGRQNGRPVRVQYNLPIKVRLE